MSGWSRMQVGHDVERRARPGRPARSPPSSIARSRSRSASARAASAARSTSVASNAPIARARAAPPIATSRVARGARRVSRWATKRACAARARSTTSGAAGAGSASSAAPRPRTAGSSAVGDRRRHGVERADGGVDRVRPGGEVPGAGRVPLGRGGVLAVVAGEVEVVEVDERVAAVGLVRRRRTSAGRPRRPAGVPRRAGRRTGVAVGRGGRAPAATPVGGEVLDGAVVAVHADPLADLGEHEVADCGDPFVGHARPPRHVGVSAGGAPTPGRRVISPSEDPRPRQPPASPRPQCRA